MDDRSRLAFLRQLPYFAELSEEDLRHVCGNAADVEVAGGELLLEEGDPGGSMYVVVDGAFDVFRRVDGREVTINRVVPGEVLGEMSLLERRPRAASARAVEDSRVIEISDAAFRDLTRHPSAALAMLDTVLSRMRSLEASLRESEQQAALGRMAAGLMHELNNPAAAVRRSAENLGGALRRMEEAAAELAAMDAFDLDRFPQAPGAAPTNALDRSDREEEIAAWLRAHGVDGAWDLAGSLVQAGWDAGALDEAFEGGDVVAEPLVRWLAARHTVQELAEELHTASSRISELVDGVKGYAYVGQSLVPDLDVNDTIRKTLVVMRHQLDDVEVVQDLGELPRIEGYGSELTQVWTNLIDNAVDAMEGHGRITITSRHQDGCVVVEVADDGPGMPPEVRDRIFQPFFTTKPPGQGTGIGLHTVYNIVVRHGGDIAVDTGDDGTTFRVRLPLQVPDRDG